MIDKITKLKTRQSLIDALDEYTNLQVISVFNIDKFARINAIYGHKTGDQVLRYAANELQNSFGEGYTIYRSNGATFTILCNYKTEMFKSFIDHVESFLDNLKKKKIKIFGKDIWFHMSVGVAHGLDDTLNLAGIDVLDLAEAALSSAKKYKKQLLVANMKDFKPINYEEEFKNITDIKDVLINNRLTPHFQAIQNVKTGKIEKYECLARIELEGKIISPYFFMDIAKDLNMYDIVTRTMILKSVEFFVGLNANDDYNELEFSINFNDSDLSNLSTQTLLLNALSKYRFGHKFIMEILEDEIENNLNNTTKFIKKIRSYGVKIAIDDFGSGYSSYKRVRELKPDILKIDGDVIKDIKDPSTYLYIEGIVAFAKEIGCKVVAEYVEDQEIYEQVQRVGIDFAQGYYIAKPSPKLVA